jgi:transcriptional regulator with XRE-family HTH domain
MDAHGISLKELADRSGKSSETLKNIIYDKVENPGVLTLKAIGDVFGVSINFLLGEPFISPEESALIENYRRSGRRGKNVIELIAKYEATAARSERNAKGKHSIPCVVPKGNIRKGIVYDTNETIEISTVVDEAYMAITITSNDLAPRFCKNDSILFEKRFPEHGEIVAFIVADRVYIRNFIEENGRHVMKCLHNHGEDMVFKRMDEIILVGTCCGVIRD